MKDILATIGIVVVIVAVVTLAVVGLEGIVEAWGQAKQCQQLEEKLP